jgi:hypothetical protein
VDGVEPFAGQHRVQHLTEARAPVIRDLEGPVGEQPRGGVERRSPRRVDDDVDALADGLQRRQLLGGDGAVVQADQREPVPAGERLELVERAERVALQGRVREARRDEADPHPARS